MRRELHWGCRVQRAYRPTGSPSECAEDGKDKTRDVASALVVLRCNANVLQKCTFAILCSKQRYGHRSTSLTPITSITQGSHRLTVGPPQSRSTPGRYAPRPPQTWSFRPNFWDVPPLVVGRSAPIKLHQILTEVGNNDDTRSTSWAIAVRGNSNSMNVQHAFASSRLSHHSVE